MKIETFVKLFSTKKSDDDKKKAIIEIMKNNHVSFADKVDRAGIIARRSYYTKEKDSDGIEYEVFSQNTAAKYMFHNLTLVDLYTTLEVDYKKSLEQFEMLNGEIIDLIVDAINEREKKEFQMLIDFACDDVLANEYEPHAFIREQINRLGNLVGTAIAPAIDNIDMEKLKEVINLVGGA